MSATTGRIFHGRQIDHGVLIEEARRRQRKAAIDTRLHWMIFRPRQMMNTETMPQDDIRVFDRPVLGGPRRQTIIACRLVHELARWVALIGVIGRHPKLVL